MKEHLAEHPPDVSPIAKFAMSAPKTTVAEQPSPTLKRFIKPVLSLAALVVGACYLGLAIQSSMAEVSRLGVATPAGGSAALLIGVVVTLAISTAYHLHTLARIEPIEHIGLRVASAYSLGQIVRYIPGKVVGLVFQASYLSGLVRPSSVAFALIVQTAYDNAWTLVFATSILAYASGYQEIAIALPLIAIAILQFSHRFAWIERAMLMPGVIRRRLSQGQSDRIHGQHPATIPTACLAVVWLPMLAGLWVLLNDVATATQVAVLAACYLLASIGSMLVFVVPSGVVVREAMFLYLGSELGIDNGLLIYSGVVLRLALTAGEIVCATIFAGLSYATRRFCDQRNDANELDTK